MKILFVCTGNTCRSPLACAFMNKKAAELGLDIQCDSAGISAFSGDSASPESLLTGEKYGVDISGHRARKFSGYMADCYDLFVTMTPEQGNILASFVPGEKLYSFDVPDPYGMGARQYGECAAKISAELDKLIERCCIVEKMSEEHIGAVAELERECFSDPWSEDGLRAELTNENARFYVYTCFGQVLGYMGMHVVLDECYIANVAVSPLHRKKGIGKRLVGHCSEKAREEGCAFISLEVRVSNEKAISLYEKSGFLSMGERKSFYSHPTENALIMTKELR